MLDSGLPDADAAALLRQLDPDGELGLARAADALLRAINCRCHGVPRALETVAGILAGDPTLTLERLLADQALFTEQVVENLVSEHYRRLPDDQRRLLEALAVFDRPVSASAVAHLLGPFFPGLAVEDGLRRLVRRYFVTHHRERATFELHPLDRQYAYARIPAGRDGYSRPTLHRRAAAYYAGQCKPREAWKSLADLQPQLDQIEQLVQAGDHGAAFGLVDSIDFDHLAVWGHSELVIALRTRLAGTLAHPLQEVRNWYMLGLAHNRAWSAEEAIACFDKSLRILTTSSAAVVTDQKGNLGRSLLLVGRVEEALGLFEENVALARRHGQSLWEGLFLGRMGEALLWLGRADEALACQQRALARSQALGDRRWQVTHLSNLGDLYRRQGDHHAALRCLQAGLNLCLQTQNRQGEGYCRTRLGQVYQASGDLAQARTLWEEGLQLSLPPSNFQCAVRLGLLCLETGASAEAGGYLEHGTALCRALLEKTPRLWDALYYLALAQLALGNGAQAMATYRQMLDVCEARGVVQDALNDLRPLRRLRPQVAGLEEIVGLLESAAS
jgi:tetratricopeptide (TPR) repeat protein